MTDKNEIVAVLGASNKQDRYSHKALDLLLQKGHRAIPIHPQHEDILGQRCYPDLKSVPSGVDTVTLYVGSRHLDPLVSDIIGVNPKRVIFNPGTENSNVKTQLQEAGILCQEACTLVLLHTNQF